MLNKKIVLSVLVSFVLVFFLLTQIEAEKIFKNLESVPVSMVFLGFFFMYSLASSGRSGLNFCWKII